MRGRRDVAVSPFPAGHAGLPRNAGTGPRGAVTRFADRRTGQQLEGCRGRMPRARAEDGAQHQQTGRPPSIRSRKEAFHMIG
ncbi:hypothetical protein X805_26630 [Sphaerotilus natans subsp. natans DSM 6575]|uniref:Uncharacterized protein n=1 Tax=Sphaerotilus natans subsp. natans DSM 6575 TaxID=1286631 RepID=A0A059KKU2_9BURK|nr:hypothetical protein X805_26630 [Sphaerotilus natans subsp. natans DSM 6575]